MVLLDASLEYRRDVVVAVATFDHGSGAAAAEAAELVIGECQQRGVPVVAGHAAGAERSAGGAGGAVLGGERTAQANEPRAHGSERTADGVQRRAYSFSSARPTEASWRADRWRFLRAVAEEHRATILTAHTRDDQAETVAMRILRGASARGLAAMAVPAKGITRPFIGVPRSSVAAYATECGVRFHEDPSNANPLHLRNRLRADLLRAALLVRPQFAAELCAIGEQAAGWRRALAAVVDTLEVQQVGQSLVVAASALDGIDAAGRSVLWPELAGRLGLTMDRRGVARAAEWSIVALAGQRMPLSGGAWIERTTRTFVIRPR